MIAIYLLAIIGLFAVIGGIRQWWINPKRKLNRSIKQMGRAERQIQKFKNSKRSRRRVELVQQNWSSRIGAKLGLLLTHKYWTALAHTKLKPTSMKAKHFKQLGKNWALYSEVNTKYCNLTPSIATVHEGMIWPNGISVKFLWFGVTLIRVSE